MIRLVLIGSVFLSVSVSAAATVVTENFSVTAAKAEHAAEVAQAAEKYRKKIAVYWLGEELPRWSSPCKVRARIGTVGNSGETKFQFVDGEVLNWNMMVQGSYDGVLRSVLPHEIHHTIFACHFREPLPRWYDEGRRRFLKILQNRIRRWLTGASQRRQEKCRLTSGFRFRL